jgi:hypothetical protein
MIDERQWWREKLKTSFDLMNESVTKNWMWYNLISWKSCDRLMNVDDQMRKENRFWFDGWKCNQKWWKCFEWHSNFMWENYEHMSNVNDHEINSKEILIWLMKKWSKRDEHVLNAIQSDIVEKLWAIDERDDQTINSKQILNLWMEI